MDAEQNRIGPMTDEEADLFRWIRYGQLPDAVRPSEMIESVDVESPCDVPEPLADPTGCGTPGTPEGWARWRPPSPGPPAAEPEPVRVRPSPGPPESARVA